MKYIQHIYLILFLAIGCGNDSTGVKPVNPSAPCPPCNPARIDTIKTFVPLPEPRQPVSGFVSIIDLGCSPVQQNDCGEILTNYIAGQPKNAVINLLVPEGKFYLEKTIYCEDRRLNLIGVGKNLSIFYVKAGVIAIWVDRKYAAAAGNYLASFSLSANGKTTDTADGIRIWQQGTVNDVEVSGFGGNGIRVDGYVIGDPEKDAAHNASFTKIYDCNISYSGLDGIMIDGSDGNACITMGNDIRNNEGWGLHESSFLGGTHIGNMFHSNKLGPFTVDNPTNASCFVGGYTEGDQPACLINTTNQVIGKEQYFSGITYK